MSVPARLLSTDNIIRKVFDETTNTIAISGNITIPPTPGVATEAKQDAGNASLTSIDSKVTPFQTYAVTNLIDTSVTPISNATYLTIIASTSDVTRKILAIEDIGEFMALYTGASGSEVMLVALPLGGGEVEVNVPAGTRLSIRSLSSNVNAGKIIFNLIK